MKALDHKSNSQGLSCDLILFLLTGMKVLEERDHTPRRLYALCSMTYLGAMLASNHSLQHVSYPTQVSNFSLFLFFSFFFFLSLRVSLDLSVFLSHSFFFLTLSSRIIERVGIKGHGGSFFWN